MADADKDRRSRMAISTVHAPPKKGGAGGAFTWGSATDTSIDFDVPRLNSHFVSRRLQPSLQHSR